MAVEPQFFETPRILKGMQVLRLDVVLKSHQEL
jgi:hypothetical protein